MTADLSGIRSLLAGITPGPWELDWSGNVVQSLDLVVRTGEHTLEREGIIPAEYVRGEDAAFIAAAPSTVARLLGIVEAQQSALAKVELACDAMDAGVSIRAGDPRTKSHAATAIRAAIREALGEDA